MAPKKKVKNSADDDTATTTDFAWTDDEIELLFEAALQFKSDKAFAGEDWESARIKYERIAEIINESYPKEKSDKFPHAGLNTGINKVRVGAKIKKLRASYKKAVDAGRKSGGGRLVATFYDKCSLLWAGSPGVESLSMGIDSSSNDIDVDCQNSENLEESTNDDSATANIDLPSPHDVDSEEEVLIDDDTSLPGTNANSAIAFTEPSSPMNKEATDASNASSSTPNPRIQQQSKTSREEMSSFLKNRRDKKIVPKISSENQMLNLAKEDITLKRKMLEKLDANDNQLNNALLGLNKTMETIGAAMNASVKILQSLATPGPTGNNHGDNRATYTYNHDETRNSYEYNKANDSYNYSFNNANGNTFYASGKENFDYPPCGDSPVLANEFCKGTL